MTQPDERTRLLLTDEERLVWSTQRGTAHAQLTKALQLTHKWLEAYDGGGYEEDAVVARLAECFAQTFLQG